MNRMLFLAALLCWATPSGAISRSWADQMRDAEAKAILHPAQHIPEFDIHGAFIRGPVSLQAVALTFDDGPGESTPAVLEVLARHHAKATFFMVGEQVDAYPDYARAVAAAGHEIGNHTYHHANFCTPDATPGESPRDRLTREMDRARDAILNATGVEPTLARMPYACRSGWVERAVEKMGYTVVRWSVDGEDWARPGAAVLADYYLKHAEPGAVLLFHDGGGKNRSQTVKALETLLTGLEKRGLRYVTIGQMLNYTRVDTAASAR